MKLLDLGLAEKGLTGEKEEKADPKKKDFVVGKWWYRDHSCSPVSLNSVRGDLSSMLCLEAVEGKGKGWQA